MKKLLKEILERIQKNCAYQSDIVFLQSRSGKQAIKRHYSDNATLCQWSGIKESTYCKWNDIL